MAGDGIDAITKRYGKTCFFLFFFFFFVVVVFLIVVAAVTAVTNRNGRVVDQAVFRPCTYISLLVVIPRVQSYFWNYNRDPNYNSE